MNKILVINGSYREGGVTDQVVAAVTDALQENGAKTETIELRNYPLEFCINCRECTQHPGEQPGRCIHEDGMQSLVDRIEAADGYVLASPTNFGSVTAMFKRFMERLIMYAYWPWGATIPKLRKEKAVKKPALLISSSAAPALLGRLTFGTVSQLKKTAQTIGAKPVGVMFSGLVAQNRQHQLSEKGRQKAVELARKLL